MLSQRKTVYTASRILTMSDSLPEAEAVCVAGGRVCCAGSREEVLRAAGTDARVVHLDGVLCPGFIDTHSHLSSYAEVLDKAFCGPAEGDIAAQLEKLRAQGQRQTDTEWILGYAYDDSGIRDKRHLTRHDLDKVSLERPVFVSHVSLHMGYANTRALQLLGMDAHTRLDGGEVHVDESGVADGLLLENAFFEAQRKLPTLDAQSLRQNMLRAVEEYHRHGFTTVQEGGVGLTSPGAPVMRAYMDMMRTGELKARVWLHLSPEVMDPLLPLDIWGFKGEKLSIGGVKYFTDGSIQGFTGALLEDYHTRPGYKGELVATPKEIEATILKYYRTGMQIAVHVNGDAAIEASLVAFEKARSAVPGNTTRHLFVHSQMASDAQLARMKACNIMPTFFSQHVWVWGDRHYELFMGPKRAARMSPAGTAVAMGIPFGLHVDTPVLPPTALGSMHTAVNRVTSGGRLLGQEQRISPLEALRAYTSYAALCCGQENTGGRIEPGRYADFALLSDNPLTVDPSTLRDIKVLSTISDGEIVYTA